MTEGMNIEGMFSTEGGSASRITADLLPYFTSYI
jgi:hypothetical protein